MIENIDHTDPGDETLQRYRYQHAYGVMLALGALRGTGGIEFIGIYCEHHEDLLGELASGRTHAFQVKTRKKELGYWTLTEKALVKSIRRFIDLHQAHGAEVERFVFVSNTELREVEADAKDEIKATSPKLLLDACRRCTDPADLPAGVAVGFEKLRAACKCDAATLLTVLKRTEFALGPDLFGFEAELIADVLPSHAECTHMTPGQLRRLVRELVEQFTHASGLPVDADARVLPGGDVKRGVTMPRTKRVAIADIATTLSRARSGRRGSGVALEGDLASSPLRDGHQVLVKKLEAGGLEEQVTSMKRRLLSAFEWVREQQQIDIAVATEDLRQLESIVEGVYADEHVTASQLPPPWGKQLYVAIRDEFRRIAAEEQSKVCNQDSDRLFGILGLLTEDCRIWWSPRFDVKAAS
ncbi:hypothetical protein HNQ07_004087 [Deinococcus metalli]|uniref:CD-NTase associated protein 4-like DNA endonuclease domain-containing protein n=1 Tax=Deinococcus metalli TaxID=1141878 RepID=A0A7W8KI52_9DEIO|nr:dsDNA nuclease domain-containing protein [Deinococcus metalli]MBB5378580.1 hypothetical protein [Deinococcus metalli]GHF58766.1 hypothetical protein GCM10017781_38830 [Deinococcus metalli]